jgi:hypothetical protein
MTSDASNGKKAWDVGKWMGGALTFAMIFMGIGSALTKLERHETDIHQHEAQIEAVLRTMSALSVQVTNNHDRGLENKDEIRRLRAGKEG